MRGSPITPRHAWQPLTPRGAAAFAAAPVGRVWLVQLIVATLVAAMMVWFVETNWCSVVRRALHALPERALIRHGALQWPGRAPVKLAENRLLALTVDVQDTGALGRVADVEVALHARNFTITSLLGYVEFSYPRGWIISLSRSEAVPWWGAWEKPVLALLFVGVVMGLMLAWLLLATLSFPLVKVMAFYANRRLGWLGSWKLTGVAMLPASFLVIFGIFLYGWLNLDLIKLAMIYLLHFLTIFVFMIASPLFLPKDPAVRRKSRNPFVSERERRSRKKATANPFAR